MVGLYCAMSGCKNNMAKCKSMGKDITFHRFPSDPSLREIWIESCHRGKEWRKPNVFLCSEHFASEDFLQSRTNVSRKRTQLIRGAVPSRNLSKSNHICCADGCSNAAPEILVKRFPEDINKRTELLDGLETKYGISLDCYPCERHFALREYLMHEVEMFERKVAEEEDLVILEVSTVDGKHDSTKLIETHPTKKRKMASQASNVAHETKQKKTDDASAVSENEKIESVSDHDAVEESMPATENEMNDVEIRSAFTLNSPSESSRIGPGPVPVLVKIGDSSQLMYLHSTPPGKVNVAKVGESLLINRLRLRIEELEERIVTQRHRYKEKIRDIEEKYTNKVKELNSLVKELKSELQSFNTLHKNIASKKKSAIQEVQRILGRSLTTNQIKKMINESEPVRWSHAELLRAYTLKHLSYGAYIFVRNHLKFPLPSLIHLKKWESIVDKKKGSQPLHKTDVQFIHGSESENEYTDIAVNSEKDENSRSAVLCLPGGTDESTSVGEENEEVGDLHDSDNIIIVTNREDTNSSTSDALNTDGCNLENDMEVIYALETSPERLTSPKTYIFHQDKGEESKKGVPSGKFTLRSEDVSDNDSTCRTNIVESETFGQMFIVTGETEGFRLGAK